MQVLAFHRMKTEIKCLYFRLSTLNLILLCHCKNYLHTSSTFVWLRRFNPDKTFNWHILNIWIKSLGQIKGTEQLVNQKNNTNLSSRCFR